MKKLFAAVGTLGLSIGVSAAEPPPAVPSSAPELVQRLGSDDYRTREEAAAALERAGADAIPALREAAKSDDPEVRQRVAPILVKLQRVASSGERLAAKKVALDYKETPLGTAFNDLRARTGLNVALDPERIADPFRKVTCATGELPAWEALDAFCAAAGLREEFRDEIELPKARTSKSGYIGYPVSPALGVEAVAVTLVDGKPVRVAGDRRTAVRVLVLPPSFPGHRVTLGTGETTLCFDIAPAPGLNWQEVSAVKIARVVDDSGRLGGAANPRPHAGDFTEDGSAMMMQWGGPGLRFNGRFDPRTGIAINPTAVANPRVHSVPLKVATPGARSLKRLEGTVFGEITVENQALITVNEPVKNTGVAFDGPGEVRFTVVSMTEGMDGTKAQLLLEYPSPWSLSWRRGANPGGIWPEAPRPGNQTPTVQAYSAAGKPVTAATAAALPQMSNDGMKMFTRLDWTFSKDAGSPAKFVVTGPRPLVVEVPFVLENVPLP